ncbi:DUF5011 domain-containing protein [Leucothrix sargassi]|nr:DUF5011 domain-containing protein [Leucothrix sargassi]
MRQTKKLQKTFLSLFIGVSLAGCGGSSDDDTDKVPPVITLSGASSITVAHGSTYVDEGATAEDAVDGVLIPVQTGVVDTETIGTYSISYDVSDSAGNAAETQVRTVEVSDQAAPVVSLLGEATVVVAHGSTYSDVGATATDAVDGTLTPVVSGVVDTATVGSYTLTYGVSDAAGNAAEIVTRMVTVEDQRAPTISLRGSNVITVPHGSSYSDEGAVATDAVDGSLTPTLTGRVDTTTVGSYTLTYNVSDAAGNAATKVLRVVKVTDQTAPSIALVGGSVVTVAYGESYTDAGANAVDAVDGELTPSVSGSVNTNVIGSYVLTYNASDAAGNNATAATRTINVTDQSPPTITLSGEAEVVLAHGSDAYIDAGASASDVVDGTLDPVMSGSVDTNTVGTYILTYNVSDSAGNAAESVSRTVKVTDQTAPVITLVGDEKVPLFHSFQFEDYDGATVSDNVDEFIAVQTTHDIDEFQVGTYTVTYTATDAAGNEAVPVTREVEVVLGFTYPASYYQYKSSPAGLGENNHEFLKLTVTHDELLKDEGIYQNGSVDYGYVDPYPGSTLVDGVFVERTSEYTGSIVHAPFSSIIEDDTYEIRILDQQYPSGELISNYVDSLGLDTSHTMPAGSEVLTLGIKQIQATYELFGEYFSSTYISGWSTLDDLLTNDCAGLGAGFIDVNDYTMTIGFGCGQQNQVSGTLDGVEYVGSSPQITSDVGTWERVTLPGSDIEAVIATINPSYFDDEEAEGVELMFVELGGVVYQGVKLSTDEEVEITVFNETAINAIIDSIL